MSTQQSPPKLVTPVELKRLTAVSWKRRSAEMERIDEAYKKYHAAVSTASDLIAPRFRSVSFELLESLNAFVAKKGGDWANVKRDTQSGGLLGQWHTWLNGEWGAVLAEQQRRERTAVEWEVKRSRFGVCYLLGNAQVRFDWAVLVEGAAALGGAAAMTSVGATHGLHSLTRTNVDLRITDVSTDTLVSAGQAGLGIAGKAASEDQHVLSRHLAPAAKRGWYTPTFPATRDTWEFLTSRPINGPGDVPGLIVGGTIGMAAAVATDVVVETIRTLGENLWTALTRFVNWITQKIFQDNGFAAGVVGAVAKPAIGICIAEICKAAAPFTGGAVALGTGIARTIDAAVERTALWWNRAQVTLTQGQFSLIGDSIEWQVVKGLLCGLWTALKGATDLAMNAFLPGTGALASVIMSAMEWIAKFITRRVELARIDEFLKNQAAHVWNRERDQATRTEGPRIPGSLTPNYFYEPSQTKNPASMVHNGAKFYEFFKNGCDASVLMPMITLNSSICGSIFEQIEMLKPMGRVSQEEFDAGVRYFSRLRRITGTYLRSCGFTFQGKTPYIHGVLSHAVYDNNALSGVQQLAAALTA